MAAGGPSPFPSAEKYHAETGTGETMRALIINKRTRIKAAAASAASEVSSEAWLVVTAPADAE